MKTRELANELQASINHALEAHARCPKSPQAAARRWDQQTPYAIHPIWCAMTLLTETTLSEQIRRTGYQVLLWHDTLEDTDLALPVDVSAEVRTLVEEMTFASFAEETRRIWERSDEAKLLKLYDKVANLLDGRWMSTEKWNTYVAYTQQLTTFVTERYGELNIVKIANAVCSMRNRGTTSEAT